MRIAVFGSTGGTGTVVLSEAINRGHQVTAFARRASALGDATGLAGVVEGDARVTESAARAIAGQDAVIVTVSGRGQPDVVRDVALSVTSAMSSLGISRLVLTSSYGMIAARPLVVASIVRRVLAKPFADQLAADAVVQASDLEWTIARATRLKPGQSPAAPRASLDLFTRGPFAVTRGAWARFLLDLAENDDYPRQIVNVTA